jgi:hypothetical protein
MPKDQGQDSIEHLWHVINEISRDMIAKSGGVQKIGAHRITDAVIRRIFALTAGSSEGERLGRAFVKAAVQRRPSCVTALKSIHRRSFPMKAFGTR